MSEDLKRQTTVLAILYAYKIGKNISLKILSISNLQPYVCDDGETPSTILDKGYAIQKQLRIRAEDTMVQEHESTVDTLPSQMHVDMIDMSSDNDWRALNVYYATMLDVPRYTILDSSSKPIVRIKDIDLDRVCSEMTNFTVEQLLNVYSELLPDVTRLSNSLFKRTMVDINMAVFRAVIDESNKVFKRKHSHEIRKLSDAMNDLIDIKFKEASDEFWRREQEKEDREEEKRRRQEERLEKIRQREQEKKEREEERRLRALKKERKIQKREERKRQLKLKYLNMVAKGEIYAMPDDKKIEKELREEERINKEIKKATGENPFLEFL